MAQVQTNAKQAAPASTGKRGRAKKGQEAFKVLFIDAENKEHNRVTPTTKSILARDKAGKTVSITMDGLPEAVKNQLAFAGLQRFITVPLKKDASNVIDTVQKTVKELTEGKLFTKGEKKAGRVFDSDFWVTCFCNAMDIAVIRKVQNAKKVSDENKKKLKASLEAMTAQERNVKIKQWMTNPIFVRAKKELEAANAKTKMEEAGELAGLEF